MNRTRKLKLLAVIVGMVFAAASIIEAKQAGAKGQAATAQTPSSAQQAPPAGAAPAARPPQELKNVQTLGGLSREQMLQEMRNWSAALGVECNYCHVSPFDRDTPRKMTARMMLLDYVEGMKHKDGNPLTCNDCHKGRPNPLRVQPFEAAIGKKTAGLQVFAGMPQDRLMQVMQAFTKALGVDCMYCHKDDFDAETSRKQIARFMVTEYSSKLVQLDGSPVNCGVCHQGHARILTTKPFPPRPEGVPEPGKKPGV